MELIIAIGNCPSSGSTYLADLLDSLPNSLCGPELHLFSPRHYFQDFERLRREGFGRSPTPSCFSAYSVRLAEIELSDYGTGMKRVRQLLREEKTFADFCERFFADYAKFRKSRAKIFFEKTPENIHNADLFLETFGQGYFLHIIRDPLYVFRSLRRRRVPFAIAAATWLIDNAPAYALRDHPRFYTMKYEDLVRDPDETIGRFLDFIGISRPGESLEKLYEKNSYRSQSRRSGTWNYASFGQMGNANCGEMGVDEKRAAAFMCALKVGLQYARHFGLPDCSFQTLANHYGYEIEAAPSAVSLDRRSCLRLLKKWLKDSLLTRDAGFKTFKAYLNPVEAVLAHDNT